MKNYIKSKVEELIKIGKNPKYESLSIIDFITEFDYATKYLSRLLKVRPFVVYLFLFKRAYFEEGKREISVKSSELGENLLSDMGNPMSDDTVKKGINDLVKLKIVEKRLGKPGQINQFEVKLPSEIREVQEMIKKEEEKTEKIIDNSKDDFYTNPQKRVEILRREDYKCFYCLCILKKDDFYLDHLVPKTQGGQNYKSNLVATCRTCNTKKSALAPENFLLQNYRNGLFTQEEYKTQKNKLIKLKEEYKLCG
ncbi:MAG: HNH endonuclease signature motif containing protein [Elusimicrobiota bacterium]|nr:HNH endonuclease signature motif containing protein [Elusimicrobiota bacterium]